MRIRQIIDEDFVNYKESSMFIVFSTCTWKCEKECGIKGMCQNTQLANTSEIDCDDDQLIQRYLDNQITKAIVFGGLEPFDRFDEMYLFIKKFRKLDKSTFVIYTGYYEDEIVDKIRLLKQFPNIIVKFGRFIPNQQPNYDEVLGISLASDNQYAKKIS